MFLLIRYRNYILIAGFSFVAGCMFTLNIMNFETRSVSVDTINDSGDRQKSSVHYIALIFSNPDNIDRRNAIRNTWLKLKDINKYAKKSQNISKTISSTVSSHFQHHFVVGVSAVTDNVRKQLRNEQQEFNDLLILPNLKDQYATLSEKLLQSIKWVNENYVNLLYLLKCDDDSFVRIDAVIHELEIRKEKIIHPNNSIKYSSLTKRFEKQAHLPVTGLYWGYFKGNAHVRTKGRWAEENWFLCGEYLPYALGGGYILSADIVAFIAKNSHYLQFYNSEDVSVGVWTAALSRVDRLHDVRFDTEWSSRGCNNSYLIRHKQSIKDMQDTLKVLTETGGSQICKLSYSLRPSYEYNWNVLPSRCCDIKS